MHVHALRAYVALIPAHGYATSGDIMRVANRGDLDTVLRAIDRSHAQLLHDRETLDVVEAAIGILAKPPATSRPDRPLAIGAVAHRIGVTPATLRKWERAGIIAPRRDPATRQRLYRADDVRNAELAHLLRRGGYLLEHIAMVMHQVRAADGPEPLAGSLEDWRQRLANRGRGMLTPLPGSPTTYGFWTAQASTPPPFNTPPSWAGTADQGPRRPPIPPSRRCAEVARSLAAPVSRAPPLPEPG